MRTRPLLLSVLTGLAFGAAPAPAVTIDWVRIGDPGNAPDAWDNCGLNFETQDCGSVAEPYRIARYEVTNAQYVEFLNAKAASDPLELYNPFMGTSAQGGITRSGDPGSYTYAVKPGFANKPVNYVSFYDSARFTNWLNNGQGSADTETGAYTLLGGTPTPSNGPTAPRNPGAIVFLPTENQWYKAAYYDGLSATYFDYPARTNTATVCAGPTATANRANCFGVVGNVTDVGSYTGSASPYGTFDQGGNVAEWNELIIFDDSRGFRGGGFRSSSALAADSATGGSPFSEDAGMGFRVASLVPEPGTAVLLGGGLLGLAARRKHRKHASRPIGPLSYRPPREAESASP